MPDNGIITKIIMKILDDFIWSTKENVINLRVSQKIYSDDAILAAAYVISCDYRVFLAPENDEEIVIVLEKKDNSPIDKCIAKDFVTSLIDHQLRIQLEKRYGKIREIIVENAFAPIDIKNAIGE